MRVLVSGGLGVIGSQIAHRLLGLGHTVSIADNGEAPRNRWIESELKGRAFIKRYGIEDCAHELIADADAVIHCAASTGIPYSVTAPAEDWHNNVTATMALLEALRNDGRRIPTVVLSSVKPYRVPPLPEHGLDETAVLEPDEPYAASKASQSMLCQAYAKSYGLPVVTFRCSNLYGPAPCHGPRHGWLTWFCIAAGIGRPIEVQGNGEQTRDMLHASDVFFACMKAIEHLREEKPRVRGEIFNLGGGSNNRISVNQAANLLHELTGVQVVRGPARAMDDDHVFVDTRKIYSRLGWEPKVAVFDGVRATLTWAQQNVAALAKLYEGVL